MRRASGSNLIDQLKYGYLGNKLVSVLHSNLSTDNAFQIAATAHAKNNLGTVATPITYNFLNLPTSVPTTSTSGTLSNTYSADGNKLRMSGNTVNFDYIEGIHYENGVFAFAQTATGRVIRNGSGSDPQYLYEYTISDHLGNGRMYFDINGGVARKIQETDYYAFGKSISVGSV